MEVASQVDEFKARRICTSIVPFPARLHAPLGFNADKSVSYFLQRWSRLESLYLLADY